MSRIHFIFVLVLCFSTAYTQEREFPYKRSKADWAILSASVGTALASEFLLDTRDDKLSVAEIEKLKRNSVNRFDRGATYNWSPSASNFSDVPYHIMPLLPMTLGIPLAVNKKWDNAFTLGLMYTEVLFFTKGITGLTKTLTARTRPYMYNTQFTPEERFALQQGETTPRTSFISGHTSVTFAYAVLLAKTYSDIYGNTTWSKIIWATAVSAATATAWARVEAGVHYPTDVLAGAIVGSALGYFIPELHKTKNKKLSLIVTPSLFNIAYKL